MAQQPRVPDVESQRAAMKRLSFLIGKWLGEACLQRGSGEALELIQSENAEYKLDGLLLMIEGIGRKLDGSVVLQALALVSCDDETGAYRMRAFNDGRYLETELKLLDDGRGMSWGFVLGEIRTNSVLKLNEKGDWTERTHVTAGSAPARLLMEVSVRRQT
jgi:hypothetical protein